MKKINIRAVALVFIMMIMSAVVESRGAFVPLFKSDFSINDTKISFMFTAASLGYIICTYIGGSLCDKLGQKKVIMIGLSIICVSLFMLSLTRSFLFLLIVMFILNTGLGLVEIAINTIVPILFLSYQAFFMNLTHFCYGLGATVGSRVTGLLTNGGVSWKRIYFVLALVYLALFIYAFFISMPQKHIEINSSVSNRYAIFKNRLIYFYIAALGFYVFAEIGTSNWFINFMKKNYAFNNAKSSFYLALFTGLFAFGRLVGGFIVEKMGYLRTVMYSLAFAFVLFISGIVIGQNGLIIISISGLFFSIVFPTVVLSVSSVFKDKSSYYVGIIITGSSFTNMVMNMLIGVLNDNIGIYTSFFLIPISLLISLIFVFLIYKSTDGLKARNMEGYHVK